MSTRARDASRLASAGRDEVTTSERGLRRSWPPSLPETDRDPGRPPDPRIVHPLDRLRGYDPPVRRARRAARRRAVPGRLVLGSGWLLDFGLFKVSGFDWVQDAPRGLRVAALVALVVLLVAIVATRVVLRLTREFSYPSLALVLEKRYPQVLGDRLITAVELADVDRAGHGSATRRR